MSAPLVSVIIPAFNVAEYIRQTLNSVLAQTYQALEVIVVDDGSSDATDVIVEEFVKKDPRFQLVRQRNAGVGAARNAAIRKARGKYIAPLDADDVWFPDKLEKQVAHMEQRGEETGLVYCWHTFIDKHGDPAFPRPRLDTSVGPLHPHMEGGLLRQALLMRHIVGNASVPLFRAASLEKVGLYLTRAEQRGAQGCEDWDLSVRIAEAFRVYAVPECLVAYRETNSSLSAHAETMAASFAVVLRRARQRNSDLPPAAFRWSGGYFYLYLIEKCYLTGYYQGCLRYAKEAIRANPVLLLKTEIYWVFLESLLKVLKGSSGSHSAKQFRPPPEKMGKGADLNSRIISILNTIFNHIERARWSAALKDET